MVEITVGVTAWQPIQSMAENGDWDEIAEQWKGKLDFLRYELDGTVGGSCRSNHPAAAQMQPICCAICC